MPNTSLENEIRTSHIPACFVYMTAGVCELTKAGDSPSGRQGMAQVSPQWRDWPSCFSQLLASLFCYQFQEGDRQGAGTLPTCQPREEGGSHMVTSMSWAEAGTVGGAGNLLSGVQAIGRDGV